MKSVLIVGLGQFGQEFARRIYNQGNDVMAIDQNEDLINESMPFLTNAQIGDSTNEQFIESLGVNNFDLCVVAIGDDFESSLQTTSLLKDCGAKFVLARAKSDVHEKFLLRNGADSVVYPERDMAARQALKYGSDNIFDFIQLTADYSIYEVSVPPRWIDRSLGDLNVRAKYGIGIIAVKENGVMSPNPGANFVFRRGQSMLIMGRNEDVKKLL